MAKTSKHTLVECGACAVAENSRGLTAPGTGAASAISHRRLLDSGYSDDCVVNDQSRRRFLVRATATMAAIILPSRTAFGGEADRWGDLVGRFVYDGNPPERKKLKVDKDVECCGKYDIRDESILVGPDGGLANVYVYLRSPKAPNCPELAASMPKKVTLDNRDCIFRPHCMKIWLGKQEYAIVNSDPIAQNVAFSPLGDTPANIVMAVGGKATHKFTRKQNTPVPIACNYHPWERAYVLPRDNPYVDISAADGLFRIARLPVGTWQFQAWHEAAGPLATADWPKGRFTFTVKPGQNDLGTIKIQPALLKAP
jgi:hypothetical protein